MNSVAERYCPKQRTQSFSGFRSLCEGINWIIPLTSRHDVYADEWRFVRNGCSVEGLFGFFQLLLLSRRLGISLPACNFRQLLFRACLLLHVSIQLPIWFQQGLLRLSRPVFKRRWCRRRPLSLPSFLLQLPGSVALHPSSPESWLRLP